MTPSEVVIKAVAKFQICLSDIHYLYNLLLTKIEIMRNDSLKTAAVYYDRAEKQVILGYSEKFVQSILNEYTKKEDAIDFIFLVILHEVLHVYQGHLIMGAPRLSASYPELTQRVINIACDWEVNRIIKTVGQYSLAVKKQNLDRFCEFGVMPPTEALMDTNDSVGHVYIYIRYMLKNGVPPSPDKPKNPLDHDDSNQGPKNPLDHDDSNQGIGSMDDDDCKIMDTITQVDSDKQVILPESTKIKNVTELTQIIKKMITPSGLVESYSRPHRNCFTGVYRGYIMPSQSIRPKTPPAFTYFIDISGSMNMEKLGIVYGHIGSMMSKCVKKVKYALVNTKIVKQGEVKDASFIPKMRTEGGTNFESSVIQLVKEGTTNFIFYTDGDFRPFAFPPGIKPADQIWILVSSSGKDFTVENDSGNDFFMPGRVLKL